MQGKDDEANTCCHQQRYSYPYTTNNTGPTSNHQPIYILFVVQGISFPHAISRGNMFCTIKYLKKLNKRYNQVEMEKGAKKFINLYHNRGLRVTQLNTDNDFTCIEERIRPVRLNVMAAEEHVGEIERSTRTIKEGTRCHVHICPYERHPKIMIVGCGVKKTKNLNQLPTKNDISDTSSTSTLITGRARPGCVRAGGKW